MSALDKQVGGTHYKNFAIQPIEFITKNGIGFGEGNVIKYVCRWRAKNGLADLEKAKHYIELLIDAEQKRIAEADAKAAAASADAARQARTQASLDSYAADAARRPLAGWPWPFPVREGGVGGVGGTAQAAGACAGMMVQGSSLKVGHIPHGFCSDGGVEQF